MKFISTITLSVLLIASIPALSRELLLLGENQFTCKKGELRLYSDNGSRSYPAGKQEKMKIATKTGILSYTCRYRRHNIICPIDTTVITLKRTAYIGKFAVKCFGSPGIGLPGQGKITPGKASGVD